MTIQVFLSRHSPQWSQLKDDLLALIDANSISHEADHLPMAVTAEGRATLNGVFADRCAGFAACRRLLHGLIPLDAEALPEEATFEPVAEGPRQTFPDMPAPKSK